MLSKWVRLMSLCSRMCQVVTILLFLIFVSGCVNTPYVEPYMTDAAKQRPLSDTSVLSVAQFGRNIYGQILSVDGVETSCWRIGCPAWVRVTPGEHVFRVRFNVYEGGIISCGQCEGDLRITRMEAKHVYDVVFNYQNSEFMVPRDLGEAPEYGMTVGLKGVNQRYVPVLFH